MLISFHYAPPGGGDRSEFSGKKRWKNGQMVLRWVGSALHEAATGFRCVRGFRDMKYLRNALARSVTLDSPVQLKVA